MKERRKQQRVSVSFPVECKLLPSKDYFYTVSKDLSLGGAKILSSEQLMKKDKLNLSVNLIKAVLNVDAKVSWCWKDKISQRYATGLEFIGLTDSDKNELAEFLTKITNS